MGGNSINFSYLVGLCQAYPAEISQAEKNAAWEKEHGDPNYDRAAYTEAMRKIRQAEKYRGTRHKGGQKGGRFFSDVGNALSSVSQYVSNAIQSVGTKVLEGIVVVGSAMGTVL